MIRPDTSGATLTTGASMSALSVETVVPDVSQK